MLPPDCRALLEEAFYATVGSALTYAKCFAFAATSRLQHRVEEGGIGCTLIALPPTYPLTGALFKGIPEAVEVLGLNVAQVEEKELLELASSSLAFLHPADAAGFAAANVATLQQLISLFPQCVALLQFFLGHQHTSKTFSWAFLEYLTPRLPLLRERRAALMPPMLPQRNRIIHCLNDGGSSGRSTSGESYESDEVLLEVYRQFDGASQLSSQAQTSDLLMLPLEMQVPIAGQGKSQG
ncbi:hypothetical protein cyc_03567 [Cyclospora cayetanensis]|uniref:Uncharacterized protein n=1 Tax=Cyclospora cayetanensis TaxID=88456 RepID=A0A1D3CW15_9EIME|nr:hypothetical protein cyc_03567 [Cyclospora cayetanensis]